MSDTECSRTNTLIIDVPCDIVLVARLGWALRGCVVGCGSAAAAGLMLPPRCCCCRGAAAYVLLKRQVITSIREEHGACLRFGSRPQAERGRCHGRRKGGTRMRTKTSREVGLRHGMEKQAYGKADTPHWIVTARRREGRTVEDLMGIDRDRTVAIAMSRRSMSGCSRARRDGLEATEVSSG